MQNEDSPSQHSQAAISTKKRIYAKALDSLTSSSQVSLVPSGSGSSSKRPTTAAAAFDEARERAAKRLRHSTSSSSISSLVAASAKAAPKKDAATSKDLPNFAPWSHEAFLARLKTFSSVSLWHPKPESINEVKWAKRGWVCVDVNTVRCKGGCEKRVVVDVNSLRKKPVETREQDEGDIGESEDEDEDESAFERALAERYENVIVEGHAETCLWRKGGCKDDIYHLQVVRPSVWQPDLRKRVESIVEVSGAIENIHMKTIDRTDSKVSSPDRLLKDLPTDLLGDAVAGQKADEVIKALEIALHGWQGLKESSAELLQCQACFQRIGLWMYQPGYRHSGEADEDHEDNMTLDLVELHREHCPWRNETTQKASGSLSGLNACQVLQRVVSTYARDRKRKSDEHAGVTNVEADAEEDLEVQPYSKEEVARQDKERESRLRKLKSLFSIKRRSTKTAPKATAR